MKTWHVDVTTPGFVHPDQQRPTDPPTDHEETPVTTEQTELNARTYGMCTGCGAVEVALNKPTGTRDLSGIGESSAYPTGYGCEVCS